ncbi:MAG: hypothetical protein V3R78_06455 [Thermodesulfobacteriota bacterium]|nr:hypothetical protein [Rhodospirillaceae bacterium]
MSTTKAFRGFIPARMKGGGYNNEAVTDMITLTSTGMTGSPTNSIFTGDPVVMPGANFATISPYIAATLKSSGVFMGCQYVENGEQKFSRYWNGGTSATDIKFFVITNPDQAYYIQASLSLSAAELLIVKNYNVTVSSTASSGSTVTGQSSYYLDGASGTEATAAVRVIGKAKYPDEKDSDAYPIVECWINQHRDRYVTATASTA